LLTAEPNGTVDAGTNTATWTIPSLDVGQTPVAVIATAVVTAADSEITNVATVSTGTGPSQQITNPQSSIHSGSTPEAVPLMPPYSYLLLALAVLAAGLRAISKRG
jgi:hypothetical protein